MDRDRREVDRFLSERNVSLLSRIGFVVELLIGLRKQDFQAAGHLNPIAVGTRRYKLCHRTVCQYFPFVKDDDKITDPLYISK